MQKQFCENRFTSGRIQIIHNDEKEIGVLELIDKENQIYIEEIQLEPDSQGRGIGSQIIDDYFKPEVHILFCDKDNIGSSKVIENDGGVLDSEDVVNGVPIHRYWVKTDQIYV